MADDYALALQKALVRDLKADAGVAALVGTRVYDQPPQSAQRPYLRIGSMQVRPIRSDCGSGATVTLGIEAHSRPVTSGRVEATRCAAAAKTALDGAAVSLTGFTLVRLQWQTQEVEQDADGESYTGIAVFEAIIDG